MLQAVAGAGALSRAEVAKRTGLSRGAVAVATDRLVAEGKLVPAPSTQAPGRGRPPRRFAWPERVSPVVLVSLGHDRRTEVSSVDADGRPVPADGAADRVGTDNRVGADDRAVDRTDHGTADDWTQATWQSWSTGVAERLAALRVDPGITHVVVSVPAPWHEVSGPVRPRHFPDAIRERLLSRGAIELPDWLDGSMCARLSEQLGTAVTAGNDANLAALGEMSFGAGRGADSGLYISVKEGVGAGIVIGGRLVLGAGGMGGELIHIQVDPDGELCVCGNRGCLATAGSAIRTVDAVSELHGTPLRQDDVDVLVSHSDPQTLRYFTDLGRTLGRALASSVTLLNPQCLVVDGTLRRAAPCVADGLRDELRRRCPPGVLQALSIVEGTLTHPRAAGARALVSAANG